MKLKVWWTTLALLACLAVPVLAEPQVETILEGLDNPSGIAIQPGTGHIFVSDSGAGRVVRVVNGEAEDVIVGFSLDVYGKGPMYNIGPLGLVFLDQQTLVVGGGDKPDGEELLRVYQVPAAGGEPLKVDDTLASFSLPGSDDLKGEGNFYALSATRNAVFVTCNGDDNKGWVSRLDVKGGKYTDYRRFIATKEATGVDAPVGITTSPRGELVVGQMGEINVPQDSLLTFYNPDNGEMLLNLETGLFDISALAYSSNGQLYALDFAWMDTTQGGLFQLLATNQGGQQGVETRKILPLDKAAAMAVDKEGALYVLVFGTAEENSEQKPGKLLKIKL